MANLPKKEEYIARWGEECYKARAEKRHRYYERRKDVYEARYQESKEDAKASSKAYRDAHKAEIAEKKKAYYQAHKAEYKARYEARKAVA